MQRAIHRVWRFSAAFAVLGLSACGGSDALVMRNADFLESATKTDYVTAQETQMRPSVFIADARVNLDTSTDKTLEDAASQSADTALDHAQVASIFGASIAKSQMVVRGTRPALLHVDVHRFQPTIGLQDQDRSHGPRIAFSWYVSDVETGRALTMSAEVELRPRDLATPTHAQADTDTANAVVTHHLAQVLIDEIANTANWTAASFDLFEPDVDTGPEI